VQKKPPEKRDKSESNFPAATKKLRPRKKGEKAKMTYDFFLTGHVLNTFEESAPYFLTKYPDHVFFPENFLLYLRFHQAQGRREPKRHVTRDDSDRPFFTY